MQVQTNDKGTKSLNTKIDDTVDTVSLFESKIGKAIADGIDHIETSPEVVKHFFRNGLGSAGYAWYKNVKVYEYGTKAAIDAKENIQLGQILHPGDDPVDGR